MSKAERRIKLSREETLVVQEWDAVAFLVLGRVLLEEESKTCQHLCHKSTFPLGDRNLHLLADIVIAKGKGTNNTCPSSCNLPGELASVVLSVGSKTEEATKSDNSDGVTKNDRVVAVGLDLLCGFLRLLLGLLLYLLGLLLDLLGLLLRLLLDLLGLLLRLLLSLLSLLLGLLLGLLSSLLGLLSLFASLGLKTFALGLCVGLNFLRLEV
jgi:hypothetical protein